MKWGGLFGNREGFFFSEERRRGGSHRSWAVSGGGVDFFFIFSGPKFPPRRLKGQ